MMDPKMDSGYLENDESLKDDLDAIQDLLPEEVIGVMDQMLSYEVCFVLLVVSIATPKNQI